MYPPKRQGKQFRRSPFGADIHGRRNGSAVNAWQGLPGLGGDIVEAAGFMVEALEKEADPAKAEDVHQHIVTVGGYRFLVHFDGIAVFRFNQPWPPGLSGISR